jgi:1-acyl-sn-glycerol-3-phosphate acyltransferase
LERYFVEPYRFIPPHRGTFWCGLARRLMPRHLRKKMGVQRWHFDGLEHLGGPLQQQAGILIASNHCRWSDPMILGVMATQLRAYFYYVASYHLFRQSKVMGWILNRIGGYSIWREGSDRESIKATVRILAEAERPIVLFPEGTWFRQNDRVGQLQEGLSLITRQAVKQSQRPIVVLPAGIKYWMLTDPRPELARRMERLERRIGWRPQTQLNLIERLEKLGSGLLAVKEIEYVGAARSGSLDERIAWLVGAQVERLEDQHLNKRHDGWILERIRRLRQSLSRRLLDPATDAADLPGIKKDLDDLLFFENLNAHSLDYLREDPSPERLVETLQRIEETLSDAVEKAVAPMGVTIRLGAPIDARALPENVKGEAFTSLLRGEMQGLIDALLAQGPPAEWGCPPRASRGADLQSASSCGAGL